MSTVRRVEASDLPALSGAFPESPFGRFTSGYTYWDRDGNQHRDEELHCYLVKEL